MSDTPNTGWLKADIVTWMSAQGYGTEEDLNAKTKAELLAMVGDDGIEPLVAAGALPAVPNTRRPMVQKLVGGIDVALRERNTIPGGTWAADVGQGPTTQQWVGQMDMAKRARDSAVQIPRVYGNQIGFLPTGATAGIPGAFTPAGCLIPATQAEVIGSSITASPASAWTTGQFVQTQTPGAAGRVCWTGTAWVGGAAP